MVSEVAALLIVMRRELRRRSAVLACLAFAMLAVSLHGCGQSAPACKPGELGCECDADGACASGLVCLSSTCVGELLLRDSGIDAGCQLQTVYADLDHDGFGDTMQPSMACAGPGLTTRDGDCNDADASLNPDAAESCNGLDDDCNNTIDDGCECETDDTQVCGVSDGRGGIVETGVCKAGNQVCTDGRWESCTVATKRAAEVCNTLDDDCDGKTDETGATRCWTDYDKDGYAAHSAVSTEVCGGCGPRLTDVEPKGGDVDCNDRSGAVHPGAKEVCNGGDDDCDTNIDDGCPCSVGEELACGARDATGALLEAGLCEPGLQKCEDGVFGLCAGDIGPVDELCNALDEDEDCDGQLDEMLRVRCWIDADKDGFAIATATSSEPCGSECPAGATATEPIGTDIDCDDTDKLAAPDEEEVCNSVDDDCDGDVDEDELNTYYEDRDLDGYGNTSVVKTECATPSGYVEDDGDCRDDNAAIKPGVSEVCDGVDNNCNGAADDGITCNCTNGTTLPCGTSNGAGGIETRGLCEQGTQTCAAGAYGACMGSVAPAIEVCNGRGEDEDCDGRIDEALTTRCYVDTDGDGYAATGAATSDVCGSCAANRTALTPTAPNIDCNDNLASAKPGGTEVCNGIDDNCVASVDEDFNLGTSCGTGACAGGHLECATSSTTRCSTQPGGTGALDSAEICDGEDNDCDGNDDDGNPGGGVTCGTNTGVCTTGTSQCSGGSIVCSGQAGAAANDASCNDADDDCDGNTDENVPNYMTKGNACTVGLGECTRTGVLQCNPGGTALVCSVSAGTAVTEICDGKDNDCDGVNDDGNPGGGASCGTNTGVCNAGTMTCTSGSVSCQGQTTATNGDANCNNLDDDCDGATDEGYVITCPNTTQQALCVNGTPTNTTCSSGACLTGMCVACTPGRYRCTSRTQSQRCDGTGNWNNDDTCTVSAPAELCDTTSPVDVAPYGTCVNNDPYFVGMAAAGSTPFDLVNNQILAQPIDITANVTLLAFGMRTAPSSGSASARAYLSLHNDSNGQPGTMVNRSVQLDPVANGSGNLTGRAFSTPAQINLVQGTRYWIVAKLTEPAAADVKLYISGASSAGNFRSATQTYGVPTDLAVGATGANTGQVTLYIQVQK